MKKFSIEILPKQKSKIAELNPQFFDDVYITHIPGSSLEDLIETAKEVISHNFNPVPHIPARSITDEFLLNKTLKNLKEIGVKDLLAIGGSVKDKVGKFDSTMDMFKAGSLNNIAFRSVRIAGHPEGNPDDKNSRESLKNKLIWLKENEYSTSIVTQFCLSPEITNAWIIETKNMIQEFGRDDTKIIIGVAGPSKITTLIKYAKVCGVSSSTNFLMKQGLDVTKLIKHSPTTLIEKLDDFDSLHFFPFGGIKELNNWLLNQTESKEQ